MRGQDCPSPEDLAGFVQGSLQEQEWRAHVRHVADCASCRRHAGLLAMTEEEEWPAASGGPRPVIPIVGPPRRNRGWPLWMPLAAAAAILAAAAGALLLSDKTPPAPDREVVRPQPHAVEDPLPDTKLVTPEPGPPVEPQIERPVPKEPVAEQSTPVPRPFPPVPPTAGDESPPPPRPPEPPAPEPPPSPYLAERADRGNVQAVEVSPISGTVAAVSDGAARPLARTDFVRPSETLRAGGAASVGLFEGVTLHLPDGAEISVCFSQSLLCLSVSVRRGAVLVDLGPAPRVFHLATGPIGIRLQDVSGKIRVGAEEDGLHVTPLSSPAGVRAPGRESRSLQAGETLVLGAESDKVERTPQTDLAAAFPTLAAPSAEAPPSPPAPPAPPAPSVPPTPDARPLVAALAAESYGYRVVGRHLREGAWIPQGFFSSEIGEVKAIRRVGDGHAILVRVGGKWNDTEMIRPNTPKARLLEAARSAQAPHLQLASAVTDTRGAPAVRHEKVLGFPCHVSTYALDPKEIRGKVAAILEQSVREGRMEPPDHVYWSTLEGTLELAATKHEPRLLRAVVREKVAYSYKTVGRMDRQWYHLETMYEFHDHGQATLALPPEIQKKPR